MNNYITITTILFNKQRMWNMKKLLVALVALTTVSAFAGNSMVRLDGCFDGTCDSLDFDMMKDDADNANESQNLAINYAMAFAGNWGAGVKFMKGTETVDGDIAAGSEEDNYQTIGLAGYYNIHGAWDDSCFVALHYDMKTVSENDTTADTGWKDTVITLEYGHRFMLGSLMGMNWNWSPSVSYAMTKRAFDDDAKDDLNITHLTLNVANVAVTF